MGQWEEGGPRSAPAAAPVPTVPPGLPELMEGLSKEVLRHNPDDIYAFCAQHMEKLIKIRNAVNEKTQKTISLTLEQQIEKTQKLVREKSEERHREYLKNLSTTMNTVSETENRLKIKHSGLKDEDLNVFFEDNGRENGEELVDAQSIETNETLDNTQLVVNTNSNDNVVEDSENLDINESLTTKTVVKEDESVVKQNLLQKNVNNEKVGQSETLSEEENENIIQKNMVGNSENLVKEGNDNLPNITEVTETLDNITQKTKTNDSIAESHENFPRETITEGRESLNINSMEETNKNSDKNKHISEMLSEKTTTEINNKSIHSDKITEADKSEDSDMFENGELENLPESKNTTESFNMIDSAIYEHNAIVINEYMTQKNQNSMIESAVKESNKLTDENIHKANESVSIEPNDIVEVKSKSLETKLIEEHTNLIDNNIIEEMKGLPGEKTLEKEENSVENNDILYIKSVEDKMLNGIIKEANDESETHMFNEGKIDDIFTDNTNKENEQNPCVKDNKSTLEDTSDEIIHVDLKNGESVDTGNNEITQTKIIQKVEIMAPVVNLLSDNAKNLIKNTTNEDEVHVEGKFAEESITNLSTSNNSELNKIHETNEERLNKPENNEIMVVTDSVEESNGIKITENGLNTINIDENAANDKLAKINNADSMDSFHMEIDNVHSTEKYHGSKDNLTQVSENLIHIREKRSIEEVDNPNSSYFQINDHNETEKVFTLNADNMIKEKNEIFENYSNDETFVERQDEVANKKVIVDKDKTTETSDSSNISSNNEEIKNYNNQEQINVTKTDTETTDNANLNQHILENNIEEKSVPDIVDMTILQNNAELIILSHTENDNIEIKTNIEDMEEHLHKPTYEAIDIEYKDVSQNPETGSSSEIKDKNTEIKTSDEQLQDSSDKKSIMVEDKETTKSDTDNNKLKTSESMDLETAAITIQKAFQAFLFESTASNSEDNEINSNSIDMLEENMRASVSSTDPAKMSTNESVNERRPPGLLTRTNTVLQTVNEEKSLSLSTDESSGLSSAATVIQAHVRGFLVRNRLSLNKLTSSDTPANSDETVPEDVPRAASAKTVLKINIPEQDNYASIEDSIDTSIDLPIDPIPSIVNLHPLGYDKDARKPLKREDAIQSISPPSNSSLKLSEEVYSPLEISIEEKTITDENDIESNINVKDNDNNEIEKNDNENESSVEIKKKVITPTNSDEMDVVTPYNRDGESRQLLHSSEFHDVLLPTKVVRTDSTVVRGE